MLPSVLAFAGLAGMWAYNPIPPAFASVPNVKAMYGWRLEMRIFQLGVGYTTKPFLLDCRPKLVHPHTDCLASGLFLTVQECVAASGTPAKYGPKIGDIYSKPPAGPNDWFASVFRCVHQVN